MTPGRGDRMNALVCFAVKEEARHFRAPDGCAVLVTGMGPDAARRAAGRALEARRPDVVLTAGFAGGLNPDLPGGLVLAETSDAWLAAALSAAGLRTATLHGSDRVATTRAEKAELRRRTGADAVEMESSVIRELCRQRGVPAATVRVISDAANEDLPIDFNELMTPDGGLRLGGLIARVLLNPGRIPGLMRLQRATASAARALGPALESVLRELASTTRSR